MVKVNIINTINEKRNLLCGGVGVGEFETQNAYFIWLTLCYVEDMHEL